ncbi:MAG: trypsin-like serine protease [Burkholderiales bacterium]|nr:trypsin-like serine protease [Burkholderiales bacterium]
MAGAWPAAAILIRADRDDAEYLELASKYTSSLLLNAPDGEGVLIAPRWILTAAHMAKALEELKPVPRIVIAGREHRIQSFHLNPDWKKGVPASDIALIYLERAVTSIEPTPLYREKDEGGKTVVIVGHGYTGKIGEKPLAKERWDRKKRAAINTVDRISPRLLGLKIKTADEASDLQGAAAPGDSGGPAFLETPQGLFVVGIGSATDDANANGIIGDAGDWELYVRVSTFVPWIEAVMVDVAKRELTDLLDGSGRN